MKSLKGQLLVATPRLLDPNFARTVLLMIEHNAEGAAGLVLNRSTGRTISEVAEDAFGRELDWEKPIHLGGPVPGPLIVLHTVDELADSAVLPGLFTTVDSEKLLEAIDRRVEPSMILVSYAGWGPGQLESEMAEGTWRACPASSSDVLDPGEDDLWERITRDLGRSELASMVHLPHTPLDPGVN